MTSCFRFICLLAIAYPSSAFSAPVFEQAPDLSNYGFRVTNSTQVADNFELSSAADVTHLTWSGWWVDGSDENAGNPSEDFIVRFFESGQDGLPLADYFYEFATPAINGSYIGETDFLQQGQTVVKDVYGYSLDIPEVHFDADTVYFISIWASVPDVSFIWGNGAFETEVLGIRPGDGHAWIPPGQSATADRHNMAFSLSEIPEPSTAILISLGLIGLSVRPR